MKFTDGFWHARRGVTLHHAREIDRVWQTPEGGAALTPTRPVSTRGAVLNQPTLTVELSAPLEGIIKVRLIHHKGTGEPIRFDTTESECGAALVTDTSLSVTSGDLEARLEVGAEWNLRFSAAGIPLTQSGHKSAAWASVREDAVVDRGPAWLRDSPATSYILSQLDLGIGESVYGLGERFGPVVKNGQSVDIWNEDGGTSSEQAYKNVPFYMTTRGYGIFVNDPGHVSFEVGSEAVERVQFSVEGESLEYFVIYGPDPEQILERYTALTGRPAEVPAWTYGLWMSTSFTTDYDEATTMSFVDGMAKREIPLSLFHFDCFWMREFNWCDFEWDARVFPDPDGMLSRMHDRGLRVCVWINPYIAQQSPLFDEGMKAGYLVRNTDGSVWQWDRWQAGMALVDFTNRDAAEWYKDKLRRLIRQGVDCFKTDFGERIPIDVQYADGSDPRRMHNLYTHLYNRAVHEVLKEERGEGDAVLFARSATAGGQQYPVHWGGDSTSSFASMAETLRGGLSLAYSGFAYWSHDIGGFEGTPDPAVFKRWVAFGLLSSHSRLHGSDSYRVPWTFDDDEDELGSAVRVTRKFARLKNRLMPYLIGAGRQAQERGTPIMRPMQMAFPDDPALVHVDRQYMLGRDLLVAPVFSAEGDVELYIPRGRWRGLVTGESVEGGAWRRESHDFESIPLYVRPGGVIPMQAHTASPEAPSLEGLTLIVNPDHEGAWSRTVKVARPDGELVRFEVDGDGSSATITGPSDFAWNAQVPGGSVIGAKDGRIDLPSSR